MQGAVNGGRSDNIPVEVRGEENSGRYSKLTDEEKRGLESLKQRVDIG